jgi:hypothetical protein
MSGQSFQEKCLNFSQVYRMRISVATNGYVVNQQYSVGSLWETGFAIAVLERMTSIALQLVPMAASPAPMVNTLWEGARVR